MASSSVSLTTMSHVAGSNRGLERKAGFDDLDTERVVRASASRYLLRADLSRFYHTLYTHSIPWALHSKEVAKARQHDRSLCGNAIDFAVRNTQDKQTLGIPVGPVTSDLISELLGTAVDLMLVNTISNLKGLRYVDDYYLYFATRSEAEAALANLHSIGNHFALEINPLKTRISELPEVVLPKWTAEMRLLKIGDEHEKDDLIAFFSSANDYAVRFPGSNVLKYAVKLSTSHRVTKENWPIYESFLLGSLVAEPSLAPTLAPVLLDYRDKEYALDESKLINALTEVASYHARYMQGFEVAWSLWIAKLFSVELPDEVWPSIGAVDDPVVALLALHLRNDGLADALNSELWGQHMTADHLYSENWLVAYEAYRKGWLPSAGGGNYIGRDDFFGVLANHDVEFYDTSTAKPAGDDDWLTAYLGG